MKTFFYIPAAMLVTLTVLLGCGDDHDSPTGPGSSNESEEPGSITFTILHEDGTPVDSLITWGYGDQTIIMNGFAFFDSLMPGRYDIHFLTDATHHSYNITLKSGEHYTHTTVIPSTVDWEASISYEKYDDDMKNRREAPLPGTELHLEPGAISVATDENGMAVVENLPLYPYNLEITRFGIPSDDIYNRVFFNFENDSLIVNTYSLSGSVRPEIEIEPPDDTISHNVYGSPLILQVSTKDFFDDQLTGKQIEWQSNRDGLLGYGETIKIDHLRSGTHEISAMNKVKLKGFFRACAQSAIRSHL